MPLISKDAKKYNIYKQCDRFNSSLFFQSPNIPLDVVQGYVSVSTSERSDRKFKRQASTQVVPTTESSKVLAARLEVMIKEPDDNDPSVNHKDKDN
jgi:hypothetical protein